MIPDAHDAIRYRHAHQTAAITKRKIPNASHAVGHRHARQTAAAIKRKRPDASDAVRYRHARQPSASIKRRRPDASHAVGYRHARQVAAPSKRRFPDARDGITAKSGRDGNRSRRGSWDCLIGITITKRSFTVKHRVCPLNAVYRFRCRLSAKCRPKQNQRQSKFFEKIHFCCLL